MVLFISTILFILGFMIKKSRGLFFLQFFWMWIILALCNDYSRVDYQNYVLGYTATGLGIKDVRGLEFGYNFLNKILFNFGLPYEAVNMIFVFFLLLTTALVFVKFTNSFCMCASLYMAFPLLLNGIQIRTSISSIFIIIAISFLKSAKKAEVPKFLIFVLIATSFHSTSIFYLVFLLTKFCNVKKIRIISIIGMVIMLPIFNLFSPLFKILFGTNSFESKLSINNSFIEILPAAIWIFAIAIGADIVANLLNKNNSSVKQKQFINLIVKINWLMVLTLPMFTIDYSFERLNRNFIVFNYLLIAWFVVMYKGKVSDSIRIAKVAVFSWYFIGIVVFEGMIGDRFNIIVKMYMSNNDLILHPIKYIPLLLCTLGFTFALFAIDLKTTRKQKLIHGTKYCLCASKKEASL